MANFMERLNEAIELREISSAELSRNTGISEGAISQYRSGAYKATQRNLEKLATALRVSIPWLMGADASMEPDVFSIPGISYPPQTVKKPRLGTIACGQPILAVENYDGYDDVPSSIHCDFTLICKGSSMIGARIYDGDVVYIRQQPEVENGQIAAVLIDGTETTLKRVYVSDGIVTLVAENPEFAPIVITKERQFTILGKAVGFTSILK